MYPLDGSGSGGRPGFAVTAIAQVGADTRWASDSRWGSTGVGTGDIGVWFHRRVEQLPRPVSCADDVVVPLDEELDERPQLAPQPASGPPSSPPGGG